MKKLNIPERKTVKNPERRPEEIELTKALKMVVDALTALGFEDFYILGLVNLIINQHINPDGTFTKEYLEYASKAQQYRADPAVGIITNIG